MGFWDAISGTNGVRPAEPTSGGRRAEVGSLPVGDYELLILDAEAKLVGKEVEDKPIVQLALRVVGGLANQIGQEVDLNLWLTDDDSTAKAFRDLATLGMSIKGSFPDLLRTFLPMLSGRRFRGARRDGVGKTNGKLYNNFFVNGLVGSFPQHDPGAGGYMPAEEGAEEETIPF